MPHILTIFLLGMLHLKYIANVLHNLLAWISYLFLPAKVIDAEYIQNNIENQADDDQTELDSDHLQFEKQHVSRKQDGAPQDPGKSTFQQHDQQGLGNIKKRKRRKQPKQQSRSKENGNGNENGKGDGNGNEDGAEGKPKKLPAIQESKALDNQTAILFPYSGSTLLFLHFLHFFLKYSSVPTARRLFVGVRGRCRYNYVYYDFC